MGFKFRKSFKILPGVRINFSKKGIGTSVGIKGFHVSTGPSGSRITNSLPGTGISHSTKLGGKTKRSIIKKTPSRAINQQTRVIPPTSIVARSPYFLKTWKGIVGSLLILMGFSSFSAIEESPDIWIMSFLFIGGGLLFFLPWIRWIIHLFNKSPVQNKNNAEIINQPPPDLPKE